MGIVPQVRVLVCCRLHGSYDPRWLRCPVAYSLGVGALTLLNVGVFDIMDPKFREMWFKFWLEICWPLWTIFFAPSAICALFGAWFSGVTHRRDTAMMLGVCFSSYSSQSNFYGLSTPTLDDTNFGRFLAHSSS
jgi:hypothetical protein